MISSSKKLCAAALAAAVLAGCSSAAGDRNSLPYAEFGKVTADLTKKTAPAVEIPYCLVNGLDDDFYVEKVIVTLFVGGMEIKTEEVLFDDDLEPRGRKCSVLVMKPDVLHSPKTSSTLLNTMLDRYYRVEGTVTYGDDEVEPVTTSGKGKL